MPLLDTVGQGGQMVWTGFANNVHRQRWQWFCDTDGQQRHLWRILNVLAVATFETIKNSQSH